MFAFFLVKFQLPFFRMEAIGDGSVAELSAPVQTPYNVDMNSTQPARRESLDRKVRFASLTEFVRKSGGTRTIQKVPSACDTVYSMLLGAVFFNSVLAIEVLLLANASFHAVWAGWGHASENPQLPEVLSKHNITFLGPSHYAMWALGDKVASTILAQSADVPTLPWSGSSLRVPLISSQSSVDSISDQPVGDQPTPFNFQSNAFDGTSHSRLNNTSSTTTTMDPLGSDQPHFYLDRPPGSYALLKTRALHTQPPNWITPVNLVSDDLYQRACVTDAASCQSFADLIGYPIMIKAAEGGGGKGIRKASNPEEIARFFPQVQSEVPGSPIFVMKCVQKCRHLEVQLLADQYGQAISLFGRDCSVQRRHQKIIEEAPIVVAPKETIDAMERRHSCPLSLQAAVRLSKLVGYVSAGTVEYLYDPCTNQFYFLELNPRLQVEHSCTEVVADVNLPACQLQIAMGIPLHQIKDIRELYRIPSQWDCPVSFEQLEKNRRPPSCYVIAARITSEDPDEGFKPRPGDVQELNFKSSQSVWGYFSVGSAGGIHEFADSQFGHCFSAAESREHARENLVLALKELSIRGDFRTTVEYLIKIMESEAFMNHKIDTDWLDKRIAQKDQVEKPDLLLGVVCTALHIADRSLRQLTRNYELHLERGQFLPSNTLTNCVDVNLVSGGTKFGVKVFRTGPSSFHLISNGSLLCIEAHRMSSDGLLVCHELASYMTYCHEDTQGYRTAINNRTMVFSKETDPSVLRSHSTGKLLQFTVADGAHVSANEVFALIEVMKLVLELRVPASGEISLKRIPGSTLEPGTELARLKLDDPTQLKILQPYNGPLLLPCDASSVERRATIQGDLKVHNTCFNALDSVSSSCASLEDQRKKRASLCTISPDHALELRSAASTNFAHSSSSQSFGSSFPLANLCQSTSTLHRLSGEKIHHHFSRLLASLEQVLLGYALPEPFLTPWINQSLENLMSFLHDPRLPLLELQDTIAHLAGRLPPQLERELRTQAKLYAGQVTSVMAHFPSNQILRLIDNHIHRIRRGAGRRSPSDPTAIQSQEAEVVKFQQTVQRLVDLSERYLNGLRGHAVHVLSQLLLGYVVVERYFQHGQYDKCTRQLLARCHSTSAWANDPTNQNDHDEEEETSDTHASDARLCLDSVPPALQNLIQPHSIADIVAIIFSHRQLAAKNALIVRLIELLRERRELSTTCDLKGSLKALTELGATGNSKVALSARQLLISLQTPSYELRRNQAESIFLSAVDVYGNQFHPENLHKLITSETVVFDILTDFFYHANQTVASAALEVYIRRAYTAYELTSIQHIQLPNGASFVPFRFTLPSAHCLTSDQSQFRKSSNTVGFDAVNTTYVSTCVPSARFIAINSGCADEKQLDNSVLPQDPASSAVPSVDGSVRTPTVHWSPTISVAQSADSDNCPDRPTRLVTATGARSSVNIDLISPIGERMGAMAAFNSLDEFEESFEDILGLFAEACTEERTVHCSLSEPSLFNFCRAHFNDSANSQSQGQPFDTCRYPAMVTFQDPPYQTTSPEEEPIHILNIALKHSDGWSDISEISSEIQLSGLTHESDASLKSCTRRVSNGLNEGDDVVQLEAFCSAHAERLRSVGIRRITFIIVKTREFPKCYTFRARDNYCEDLVYRHLEPALAFQLELNRMRNYKLEHLPTLNRRMHLYLAKSKLPVGKAAVDYRFFVRCIIRHADLLSTEASFEFLQSEAERTLLEAMDALELAHTHPDAAQTMGNHIFLNFAPILFLEDLNHLKSTIRKTVLRYARRFIRLRVTQAELKLRIRFQPSEPPVPIRVTLNDEQGFALGMDVYREVLHPTNGEVLLWSLGPPRGPLHGLPALLPHEKKDYLQLKRFQARKFNTTYVYDYPKLITQALLALWSVYNPDRAADILHSTGSVDDHNLASSDLLKPDKLPDSSMPVDLEAIADSPNVGDIDENVVLSCTELALDAEGKLRPVFRSPGSNSIGMVMWHMVLRTPDTPTGRAIIVIANDATHMAGSFGPAEDLSFHRASHLARRLGIPRIYLASNTGARIRVAEEVKAVFRVAWLDPLHPEKGYDYLYLTPEDYEGLRAHEAVNCERLEVAGEVRYKILDIVGKSYDMSVENLRGSAMIAGETSAAYDDIFTVTIVTNRAIGIGAYLARLGQRVIQVKNSHIILTGAMALNKLLGREVYSSNSQLGGVQVMANNGVSHLVASDELLALQQALDWLTYVPAERGQSVPIMCRPVPIDKVDCAPFAAILNSSPRFANRKLTHLPFDPVDRDVEYVPSRDRSNDDPRWMFAGVMASHLICSSDSTTGMKRPTGDIRIPTEPSSQPDHWLSGFFDWGTWRETLASWAAGVVVGRARLGGIPCGAITAETRSVTCHVPADPANLSTEAQVVNQAGQVWYPDSAYKTAQAITDMARERLPLFVFASWRGFSGGMKDMYDQVLKFGSMIIDSLRRYPEPVFVYLPPHSQLRGGAWVVVDPAINPDRMEMYADPISCRAGVLEPEGTVEIKYRKSDLIKTMHRLDEECKHLIEEIDRVQTGGPVLAENSVVDPNLPVKDQRFHLQAILESRHKELRPFYHQVACTFADLHDTPGRLLSRGLVHGLVPWSKSRSFFYARLRRRLLEFRAIRLIDTVLGPDSKLHHEDDDLVEHFQKLNVTTRNITQVILGLKELQDSEKNCAIMKDGLSQVARFADSHRTAIPPHPFLPECPPASPIRRPSPPPAAPNKVDSSHAVGRTRGSVEITDEIAKSVPQLAIRYSPKYSRSLSYLRKWFIDASTNQFHSSYSLTDLIIKCSDVSDENLSGEPSGSSQWKSSVDSERYIKQMVIWNEDHLAVGDWLAEQLGIEPLKRIPISANLDRNSVLVNKAARTSARPSLVHEKVDALCSVEMFERLRAFLSQSSDVTDQLGAVLTDTLDTTQRAHLVQLLSSSLQSADQRFDDSKKFPQQSLS
ncbi:acetyl-CoA carboxylase / biotin carboxylase 1 [Paragonimus westermani]|uniref:Acetyl-CoA carboxylase / biotin carboxylase 1 n=1 Tax=Paragonimus westermani TaxID=34504 RepID=A0A5J4NM52_9TREM|nr:acetyl-CoA carboxylase / biotin carboxylase 1 [Paragonimus westermani]